MPIKLIACDLDGTLLNHDKLISEKNLAAIRRAMQQGVYFTLATGRHINSARYFGEMIAANAPLVACNGGLVQPLADGLPPIYSYAFPADFSREFLSYCFRRGWYAQWYRGEEIFAREYRPEYFHAYRTVANFTVQGVGTAWENYLDRIIQFVVRDETGEHLAAMLAEIAAAFPGKFDLLHNTPREADIMARGITKATGIEKLMEHLGLTKDEVLVMGDAKNDLPMLRWALHSAVPADGQAAAKALAEYIAPPCDADAVAAAIDYFLPNI